MKIFFIISLCVFVLLECEGKANSAGNALPKAETNIKPTPAIAAATPKSEKKMDKQQLAKRVEPIDSAVSAIILDEKSQLQQINAPFLKNGVIHKVSKFAPTRRIEIFIGTVEPDFTSLIGDAKKYFEFIRKSGLIDSSDELRVAYLVNFLEITNSGKRLQILNSVDEIKQRPNLNDAQKNQFEEFRKKFSTIIAPPKRADDGSYAVFAIKGQDLVKFNLTIKEDKSVEKKETVLEANLLIPYSL